MAKYKVIKKTGKRSTGVVTKAFVWALLALAPLSAKAADPVFTAEVDRAEVGVDESVALTLSVQADSMSRAENLRFQAPDFDLLNEFNSSNMTSRYDSSSGRIVTRVTQKVTKMLRPRKTGNLPIEGISIEIGGKKYTASDITVQVTSGGAGTAPPRGYGGSGVGLKGAGKQQSSLRVLIRAEVDKDRLYKGQQVVVSYYLYRRIGIFNIEVSKFPELKGFLRDEMDMPVMGRRLESEQIVLDGVVYQRSLLARYAAYPLQEGKLTIDPLGIKYQYQSLDPRFSDEEDPFFGLLNRMAPHSSSAASEVFPVEVLPLPKEGKPQSFSGGVGDFSLSTAVDKYEVKANEALTLTAKIEGRGNVSAITEPKAKWPDDVELYESKGQVKNSRGGVGEKIFEFLLIPRTPGKVVLPGLEFSFFDPNKKTYVTRTTDPIEINVLPGLANSQGAAQPNFSGQSPKSPQDNPEKPENQPEHENELSALKLPSVHSLPLGKWLFWGFVSLSVILLGWMGVDTFGRYRSSRNAEKLKSDQARSRALASAWEDLRSKAAKRGDRDPIGEAELKQAYDLLEDLVLETIDEAHAIGARSLSRAELQQILVGDKGIEPAVWQRVQQLLEHSEMVRFAGLANSTEAPAKDLKFWVNEAQSLIQAIRRRSAPSESR